MMLYVPIVREQKPDTIGRNKIRHYILNVGDNSLRAAWSLPNLIVSMLILLLWICFSIWLLLKKQWT